VELLGEEWEAGRGRVEEPVSSPSPTKDHAKDPAVSAPKVERDEQVDPSEGEGLVDGGDVSTVASTSAADKRRDIVLTGDMAGMKLTDLPTDILESFFRGYVPSTATLRSRRANKALSKCLGGTITRLELNARHLSTSTLAGFIDTLSSLPNVTHLDVKETALHVSGARQLCEKLGDIHKLTSVTLQGASCALRPSCV